MTGPLVLVLDDLHWAAPPTLALLRHILRPRPSSLLVVGTYRHTEVGPDDPLAATLADLRREPGVERIILEGLDEDGVVGFRRAARGPGTLGAPLTSPWPGRSTPARRATRSSSASSCATWTRAAPCYGKDGRWSYYEDADGLGLPEGVRDVVARRLRRLSAGANRVLTLASVVGLEFDIELLETSIGGRDTGRRPRRLGRGRRGPRRRRTRPGPLPVRPRPGTGHGLLGAHGHPSGPPPPARRRRARLPPRETWTTPARPLPTTSPRRLPTAPPSRPADYALAAARQAFAQAAWDDVLAFVRLGLGVLSTEPKHLERRFDLLLLECETQFVLVKIALAIDTMRLAAETALTLGSPERLARAVSLYLLSEGRTDTRAVEWAEEALRGLDDSERALRARVLAGLAVSRPHLVAGRTDEETLAALALARASGDTDAIHAALVARRSFLCETPRAQEWLTVEEELAAVGPPAGPVAGSRWLHGVGRGRAVARLALGDRTGFDADGRAVDRWFTELRNTGLGTQLAIWRGAAALLDGRFAEVEAHAAALAILAPTLHEAPLIQRARLALDQGRAGTMKADVLAYLERWPGHNLLLAMTALIHVETGNVDNARLLVDALAADDFAPALLIRTSTTFAYLAEVVTALGDMPRAARIYELYAPYAGLAAVSGLAPQCPGAVDRYLGQLASTLGQWDDAQRHYEAATVLEEGLRAPPLLARTRYWYGRMLVERSGPGDAQRAEGLLGAAAAVAEDLGMARLREQIAEVR